MNNASLTPDTRTDAALKQIEILRRLGLQGRAALTFQLSENLRAVTEAGIKFRHPDYTQEQIKLAYLCLTLEPELFNRAFPQGRIKP